MVKKEILFVSPRDSYLPLNFVERMAVGKPIPYALWTLAALTPEEYRVRFINQKIFWSRKDFVEGALVAITCLTSAAPEAYRLADRFRQAGSRVVLGGPHVSALPEEAQKHADSVVVGEAESVWGRVVDDFGKGRLQGIYKGEALEDFFTPVVGYFLRMDPSVLARIGVHIDRGCKYQCDFCARISSWRRSIKMEQVLSLVRRIASAPRPFFIRRPRVLFRCDNIYSDPSYAKALFRELIPLRLNWSANCSLDIAFDDEALRLARDSGCEMLFIGFESQYPEDFKKTSLPQLHSLDDYRIAIGNFRARGIKIIGSFILGQDRTTHRDYLRLLGFLMSSGLWHFVLTILTPFPGSALYERFVREKRILSFDWRRYNFFSCVIRPRQMSVGSVYLWYWFIRLATCLVSPGFYFNLCLFLAAQYLVSRSWDVGYDIGWRLFRRY